MRVQFALEKHVQLTFCELERKTKSVVYTVESQKAFRKGGRLQTREILRTEKGSLDCGRAGGVRHGPQRVMGKNITDIHFTRDTME